MDYYSKTIDKVLEKINSSENGLTKSEAEKRLEQNGPNELPKSKEKATKLGLLLSQFKSPLMWILVIAGVISGFLREFIDMTVILITVFVNAGLGFFQEFKANRSMEKLASMVHFKALVLRDGKKQQISAEEIVVGDILLVEMGDKIQADARLIEQKELAVIEAALTGESEPQKKEAKELPAKTVLADRTNMIYRSTTVASGRAKAIVVATGKNTEIGKIASLVRDTRDDKTPLQLQLAKMAKIITVIVVSICIGIFFIGLFFNSHGEDLFHIFETAVAVAVAAIPEGLVISLTIILAIGMQFVLKRDALVRKLIAAETLGGVSVICTDKTGTITEGTMRLTRLITVKDDLDFDEISVLNKEKGRREDALIALKIGALANDGVLEIVKPEPPFASSSAKAIADKKATEGKEEWKLVGDTTDTAFIYAAQKAGIEKQAEEEVKPRIDEIPFDSKRKFMATLHSIDHESVLFVKGSSEFIFKHVNFFEEGSQAKKMSKEKLEWFKAQEKELTSQGLRVLAVAYRRFESTVKEIDKTHLDDLVLVGLVGLSDPIRPQVKETIALAKGAGIRTVMITGDHIRTAQAIAGKIGIPNSDKQIFDGERLEKITDDELEEEIKNLYVFARVDPKHKIRIVRVWQKQGEVVAMTGDGVNDAPAIKAADIGVALGSGTDVAKEISDMVLLDNDYNTIVESVEEGRTIYQNIKKVVLYLLSGSFAEAVMIVGSMIAGLPLAALPVQILWVNIIEDTFPNMALAFDKGDKENMSDPPRRKEEKIIDKEMKTMIITKSILANVALFAIFVYFYLTTQDIALTRTLVFVGFGIDALFYIFAIRSLRHPVWQTNPLGNKYLLLAVGFSWLMLIGAIYLPPLQKLLSTVSLNAWHWALMVGFGVFNLVLIEFIKWLFIHRKIRNN